MSATSASHIAHHHAPTTAEEWQKVTEGLTRRFSGDFPYARNRTTLKWRTERERAAISILALEPRVDNIEIMPEHVTLIVNGQRRDWFPALRVTSGRNVVMADVIRDDSLTSPGRCEITELLTHHYDVRGIHYRVLTESRVRKEPRFTNARLVLGYRELDPDPDTELAVVSILAKAAEIKLRDLEAKLEGFGNVRAAVFAMATRGQIKLDLWASNLAAMGVKLVQWEGLR